MATKSILKNINIKDRHSARSLINALEQSRNTKSKDINYSKVVKDIPKDKIKSIFG